MLDVIGTQSFYSCEYEELSPVSLRKYHTSPTIDTFSNRTIFDQEPLQFASATTLPEMIVIWSNQKSIKEFNRVVIYACLCELTLRERISTFTTDMDEYKEDLVPSFCLYVINKKTTGYDALDEVLSTIVKIQKEGKSISNVMKEVEQRCAKKVIGMINSSLIRDGVMSLKTNFLGFQKFEIQDMLAQQQIESDVRNSIMTLSEIGYKEVSPSTFAFLGLLSGQSSTIEKETGECKAKIYSILINMILNYESYQKNIVMGSILERLHHILCEFSL
ncbi:developmentally-regulated protein [Acrasis kona]|uniref:Developmentally-regulated protein n=1 Tax=Acrasis kona TaxID=1008807 RepID=A0AAW2Z9E0_9EUKA